MSDHFLTKCYTFTINIKYKWNPAQTEWSFQLASYFYLCLEPNLTQKACFVHLTSFCFVELPQAMSLGFLDISYKESFPALAGPAWMQPQCAGFPDKHFLVSSQDMKADQVAIAGFWHWQCHNLLVPSSDSWMGVGWARGQKQMRCQINLSFLFQSHFPLLNSPSFSLSHTNSCK